eukprot:11470260-Alexandrium_andersonii.AAC.1
MAASCSRTRTTMARCAPHRRVRFGLFRNPKLFPQPLATSLSKPYLASALHARALACRVRSVHEQHQCACIRTGTRRHE